MNREEKKRYESHWRIFLKASGYETSPSHEQAKIDAVGIVAIVIVAGFMFFGWVVK